MKLIQLLYAIEYLARESEMTHQERHKLRLNKSLPILNVIGQYIQQERNKVTPQSPIGKALNIVPTGGSAYKTILPMECSKLIAIWWRIRYAHLPWDERITFLQVRTTQRKILPCSIVFLQHAPKTTSTHKNGLLTSSKILTIPKRRNSRIC